VITNYKLQKAKSKDIKLQTNINIPDDLIVDEKDIATILGNILDNAIEACEKLDEDKRYIVINIGVNKGYLNIYVENSSVGNYNKIGDKFITTKATNIRSHGIGLSNVRYIVERNDGIININAEDDRFTIKISIIF
jgi:sensor histidine kinase regulating citrate/malate metabolism